MLLLKEKLIDMKMMWTISILERVIIGLMFNFKRLEVMITILIIVGVIWLIGVIVSYLVVFKDGGYDYPIWYSIFWFLVLLLFGIHK